MKEDEETTNQSKKKREHSFRRETNPESKVMTAIGEENASGAWRSIKSTSDPSPEGEWDRNRPNHVQRQTDLSWRQEKPSRWWHRACMRKYNRNQMGKLKQR
jgi:hypothetical protein